MDVPYEREDVHACVRALFLFVLLMYLSLCISFSLMDVCPTLSICMDVCPTLSICMDVCPTLSICMDVCPTLSICMDACLTMYVSWFSNICYSILSMYHSMCKKISILLRLFLQLPFCVCSFHCKRVFIVNAAISLCFSLYVCVSLP